MLLISVTFSGDSRAWNCSITGSSCADMLLSRREVFSSTSTRRPEISSTWPSVALNPVPPCP
jgi:hypothetical protein